MPNMSFQARPQVRLYLSSSPLDTSCSFYSTNASVFLKWCAVQVVADNYSVPGQTYNHKHTEVAEGLLLQGRDIGRDKGLRLHNNSTNKEEETTIENEGIVVSYPLA